MVRARGAGRTLFVVDEYFPQTSAPAVRIRSFVKQAGPRDVVVLGGCRAASDQDGVVEVPRPDERRALAFAWFLLRMNIAAVRTVLRVRPRTVVVSIPKYELLLSFPLLRVMARRLVLDVRDSIDFIDYGAYFSHVMPSILARACGSLVRAGMRAWFWACSRIASVVTVANEGIARKVRGSVVVSNGVDVDLFRVHARPPHKGVHVMYVGNFAEKDLFNPLVDALREVKLDVTVHVVGGGRNKERVLRSLRDARLRVVDHGVVSHEHLPELMARADVGFLFRDGSVSESIPVAFYEFVSSGVPVMTNPVGITGAFVAQNGLGWVVESAEDIRQAIAQCRSWGAKRRARLHELAKECFSRTDQARRFWRVIGGRS